MLGITRRSQRRIDKEALEILLTEIRAESDETPLVSRQDVRRIGRYQRWIYVLERLVESTTN